MGLMSWLWIRLRASPLGGLMLGSQLRPAYTAQVDSSSFSRLRPQDIEALCCGSDQHRVWAGPATMMRAGDQKPPTKAERGSEF
ncbi:unnamed protein product [Linum trigynum]|uniref:Secreted protein n=1 Tax=Linum trigynum TaxID=586398 RepID=A0AAV2F146_9ROSI